MCFFVSIGHWNCAMQSEWLGPFVRTIPLEVNMNWSHDNEGIFMGIASALYFVGALLASFTLPFYKNVSPIKILSWCCGLMIIFTGIMCIPNTAVLFLCRFLNGYVCGCIRSIGSALLYTLTPPDLRTHTSSIYTLVFTFGIFSSFFFGIFDDAGKIVWRLCISWTSCLSLIFLALKFTVFSDVDSISYMIKFGKEKEARALMEKYMADQEVLEFTVENVKKMIAIEEADTKRTGGGFLAEIKTYKKEFWMALFMGQATAYCGFQGFLMFNLVFINKDEDNKSDLSLCRILGCLFIVNEILFRTFINMWNINKYRKTNYLVGHTILAINWFAMCYSYSTNPDVYTYPKVGGFILAAVVGGAAIATFYVIITDICSQSLCAVGQGGFLGGMIIVTFCFPFIIEGHTDLDVKTKNLQWLTMGMGIVTSLFTITGYFYMIETEGLEKEDIYFILRGKKTREQC